MGGVGRGGDCDEMGASMTYQREYNPLLIIVGKQLVGQDDADIVALPVLVALDAAKRGLAPNAHANTLAQHLLAAQAIWSSMNNAKLYKEAVDAWNALGRACQRPTQLLDLTTREYAAIRAAIAHYVMALPRIEIAKFATATELAVAEMAK